MNRVGNRLTLLLLAACLPVAAQSAPASPGHGRPDTKAQRVVDHWTPARRAAAIPRDLVQDGHGHGYLRLPNGALVAHGKGAGGNEQTPMAKPGGGDHAGPSVTGLSPSGNITIGTSAAFSAAVSDPSGVRSVTFRLTGPSGTTSYAAASLGSGTYGTTISNLAIGNWSWVVVANDATAGTGNTTTSASALFKVGGSGGGGGSVVSNSAWNGGGTVQTAAGRIYFEMPSNSRKTRWSGYICSGTVATDGVSGRSILITASHCVYDDHYKAFARNVLFIPNQDATTGSATDLNCSNDPLGCWAPAFGVVDKNWTTRTFPDNVDWDYAYYVFDDTAPNVHSGNGSVTVLDTAAGSLSISFAAPSVNASDASDYTHALGYSASDDPNFMFCAQDMGTEGTANWWLGSCGLSGGASGGPWMQPVTSGNGPIISVNSWGYTSGPGMAGPKLSNTSAQCIFGKAKGIAFGTVPTTDGNEGVVVDAATCPP